MNDTPKEILLKQFEIIYSKPLKERLENIFELTELSRKIITNQLKIKYPKLSDIDIKIEMFKAFYRFDYDPDTLNKIAHSMKIYLQRNQSL